MSAAPACCIRIRTGSVAANRTAASNSVSYTRLNNVWSDLPGARRLLPLYQPPRWKNAAVSSRSRDFRPGTAPGQGFVLGRERFLILLPF